MSLSRAFRAAFRTLLPAAPVEITPLPLRVEPELSVLSECGDLHTLLADPGDEPGSYLRIEHSRHIDERELRDWLDGRVGGVDPPPWADGTGGALISGVCLCRVKGGIYASGFGAMITPDGAVLKSTVGEALYLTPDLAALPSVTMSEQAASLAIPPNLRKVSKATVFMAWGGRFNYGHFVLDCLPALCVAAEAGVLNRYPPLAPELTPWHRRLLSLMLGDQAADIQETSDPLIDVEDALFATPMDHFLHAPNTPLDKVRARILARLPQRAAGPERLYLSRRKDGKRMMLNEAAFEDRLKALDFAIVQPEDLSVDDQIQLFRNAKTVVGATGAAFANCLFCDPKTKIFEIQPSNYTGIWTRSLSYQMGLDWHGYFAPSPDVDTATSSDGSGNPNVIFSWNMPIDDFVAFMSRRLDQADVA